MLLFLVILLSVLLLSSVVIGVILYKAGVRQMESSELYQSWISEFKYDVLKTYTSIKFLDDKQIFSKDDEVGIVFKEMESLIRKLNERTQDVDES